MGKTLLVCLPAVLFLVVSALFPVPVLADVGVSPTSLSFGSVTMNTTSSASTVVLTNDSRHPVSVSLISSTVPEFIVVSPSMPMTLAGHGSASFQVMFQPNAAATFSGHIVVSMKNKEGSTSTRSVAVTGTAVAAVPVSITTGSLSSGQVSSTYAATLTASGGTSPYSWSVSSGTLPAGLSLSASSGQINGTPTQNGTSTFTIQVKDSSSPAQTATESLSITIAATPVQISNASVPSGQVGTAYSMTLASSGGTTPYSWTISSGALPAGLTLPTAGTISGTPTVSGSFTFTVKVTDSTTPTAQTATESLTITVAAAVSPVTITTSMLPAGQVGVSYSTLLAASGGTTPYSWSLGSGILPAGLSLSTGGTLFGTPTTAGSFTSTIKITDSTTPTAQTATKSLTFTAAAANGPVQITTTSVPAGQVSVAYSTTLQATEGTTPYTWSINSGSLPAGLTLSAGGTISGSPTATGSSSFTVKVTDSGSPATSATASFSITISAGSGQSVLLNWTASPSAGVTGYNVYRSAVDGSGYAKINSSPVASLTYTDGTVAASQTYYYVTTAVDAAADESGYSEVFQAIIP